jgi:class 3 adenylate cyclase/tetratricopeptide (TPR) repeat protein
VVACASCGELNPEAARFCHACGAQLAEAPAIPLAIRKTVTVVFCDVVDSTARGEQVDPETLRRVMSRYFDEMREAIERHGGTVEKFIGDAVMAVFGVPMVHEDDALRAVRAAAEMRHRLERLNAELEEAWAVTLEMRIGINTGEAVAGARDAGATIVTGDVVNTAKRLEEAAEAGAILAGPQTHRLVAGAVEATPLEPLRLKGKRDPVEAWRIDGVDAGTAALPRGHESPFVGREGELASLRDALALVEEEWECRLFTVLGAPGLGKSRLARELARSAEHAVFLIGHCLPYGDGITFWPLAEIVRSAGGEDAVAAALAGSPDADVVLERVRGALGAADAPAAGEETFWAVRKLVEALARTQPVVVCFEDIHWGEPTLLDLIEYLAGWTRGAPVLLLCLARHELVERRPSWLAPRPNAHAVSLEPLTDADAEALLRAVGEGVDERARTRIAEAAEGNPLFVEQMAAMAAEGGEGATLSVPPTIQALLAARLDRLEPEERAVIERAAVVGRGFWRGAVRDLAPSDLRESVAAHLLALVRKELIQPDASSFEHEDAFRFRHVLIRDAAYDGMPKELRADLHEQFAGWIERNAADRATELEEIAGYHLEQAYRHRVALAPPTDREVVLARRAGEALGSAARRALARADMPAAANLLARAVELGGPELPDRPLLLRELAAALWAQGDLAAATEALSDALDAAVSVGDRRIEWYARLDQSAWRGLTESDAAAELERVASEAIEVFRELEDDLGLARSWRRLAQVARRSCRFAAAQQAADQALAHAEAAGDTNEIAGIVDLLCTALLYGPARADRAAARCGELAAASGGDRMLEANVASSRAGLEAMLGNFDRARQLVASAATTYDELGHRLFRAGLSEVAGPIELLAGRPDEAERELRTGFELVSATGDNALLASPALMLVEALLAQGRHEEARHFLELGTAAMAPDDMTNLVLAHTAAARIHMHDGDLPEAEEAIRKAVDAAACTDALVLHADALTVLGEVLEAADRRDEAQAAFRSALALYEQKEHRVAAKRLGGLVGRRRRPRRPSIRSSPR